MPNRKYFAMKTAPVAVGLECSEVVSFHASVTGSAAQDMDSAPAHG